MQKVKLLVTILFLTAAIGLAVMPDTALFACDHDEEIERDEQDLAFPNAEGIPSKKEVFPRNLAR